MCARLHKRAKSVAPIQRRFPPTQFFGIKLDPAHAIVATQAPGQFLCREGIAIRINIEQTSAPNKIGLVDLRGQSRVTIRRVV
jgi:hypothetical protein